ncbi:MAG TPA: pilus assembly protein PilB, partial [Planctomycetota bacterium]|nr:pilus assembly protein PilB [Planctomycetota bacterium]
MSDKEARRLLGQILKEQKACHQGQIQEALTIQRQKSGQIGQILIELGHITQADLVRALAAQAGMDTVTLDATAIPESVIAKVDATTAQAFRVVPYRIDGNVLHVAMADPMSASVLTDLEFM